MLLDIPHAETIHEYRFSIRYPAHIANTASTDCTSRGFLNRGSRGKLDVFWQCGCSRPRSWHKHFGTVAFDLAFAFQSWRIHESWIVTYNRASSIHNYDKSCMDTHVWRAYGKSSDRRSGEISLIHKRELIEMPWTLCWSVIYRSRYLGNGIASIDIASNRRCRLH